MNSYLLGTHAGVYVARGLRLNANRRRPSSEDHVRDRREPSTTNRVHLHRETGQNYYRLCFIDEWAERMGPAFRPNVLNC